MTLEERFNYVPPNGKFWKQFDKRLKLKLDETMSKNKTVVVVTHRGAIRTLIPHLLGSPKEESSKYDPSNASLTVFEYEGNKFVKRLIDGTSHLNS